MQTQLHVLDETQSQSECMHTETHTRTSVVVVVGNVSFKCCANGQHLSEAGYKYINNTHTHTTTAKTWGLISHAQPVHLVNVKRAVIVNYIPI